MKDLLDNGYDGDLLKVNGLTWLPWVGKEYKNNKRRILIVGESHYQIAESDDEYKRGFETTINDKELTRNCVYECPIIKDWDNKTYDNIHKVLLKTNKFDKELFWKQIAFYNFVQRLMDYRVKERPSYSDFFRSWEIFLAVVKILNPTDCIFIGVSASNSFNEAMKDLNIPFTPVKWLDGIGTAYARTASLEINKKTLKLSFIQHASKYFNWSKWNAFLNKENNEALSFLKSKVLVSNTEELNLEPEKEEDSIKINIPMHLSHKPIIAADYSVFTGVNDDAKYLSIGHAQYDNESASIKIFRYTGEQWSRQSEEVPINRVADLTLLLLASIKKVKEPKSESSLLNEQIIKSDELDFLKDELEINKDRIKTSLLEVKRLLKEIDIENW